MSPPNPLDAVPITPGIGALIAGLDLTRPLDDAAVKAIRELVLEHGVVFFRDQDLTRDAMLAFMEKFGVPCTDPFSVSEGPVSPVETIIDMPTRAYSPATAVWHTDSSLAPEPASLMALRAVQLPPRGGDTCWSSMYAAYDALSEPIRHMIDGLTALHSAYKVLPLMGGSGQGFRRT